MNACKARIEAKKKRDEEESAGKKELQIQVKKNRDLVQEEEYKSNQHLQKKRIAEKAEAKKAKEEINSHKYIWRKKSEEYILYIL